jgi:phosphohistidine phosphatase SixA
MDACRLRCVLAIDRARRLSAVIGQIRRRVAAASHLGFVILLGVLATPAVAETHAVWNALASGGHVALLRHARAPGTGDPAEFSLGDCQTQRNLSDAGRDQARRIGGRFRNSGIESAAVFSSQWCRCLQTARLLGLGKVQPLPALNSFFGRTDRRGPQTQALREWIASRDLGVPTVLVTHQVNITALTGVYPTSGELVVVHRAADGALSVVGTIATE